MKELLKNNPTLVFGLGLPLLLVAVFLLAAGLPNLNAVPPKYDMVFATNYNSYSDSQGVQIKVIDGRAKVTFVGECNYCQAPEVYRYIAQTGALKRITIDIPPELRKTSSNTNNDNNPSKWRVTPLHVPELESLKLDDSSPAPDGYQFDAYESYSRGGILPSLFFSGSYYNSQPTLSKDGYRIRLPLPKGYYNSYNVRFIGWVVQP